MKFQDENFSGEIVESDKLRWAVLDDGRKIPATIMLDYFRGVVPESVIHEILGESVKMHRIKERNLRRNVNRNGYPLDYIKQERVEFEDEIYSNLLSFAGLEYRDGLPFKIYYSENLTYYRTMKLTKGAKKVTFKFEDGSNDSTWISGECWIYRNGNLYTHCEIALADFIDKVYPIMNYQKSYELRIVF